MSDPEQKNNEVLPENSDKLDKITKIERLRCALHRLEDVLVQLEKDQSGVKSISLDSLESWAKNTETLANKLAAKQTSSDIDTSNTSNIISENQPQKTIIKTEPEPQDFLGIPSAKELETEWEEEVSWLDKILPSFNNLQAWWDAILSKIRTFLPQSINEKLSDWALTSILSSIVVIILLTSVSLLSNSPEDIAEIGEPVVEVPPELKITEPPKTIPIEPLPEPFLTPEQSLVAAIQAQVTEITNQYSEGLILSVEAEFLTSNLRVIVSDDWFELKQSRQERLANDMLNRSRSLDFKKLQILDQEGNLLARNPFVGDSMVILKR